MKVQKMVYLDKEVNDRLKKLGRFQSELINAVLKELLSRVPEEQAVAYRVRHGTFEGILREYFSSDRESGGFESRKEASGKEVKEIKQVKEEAERLW